MAHFFFIVFFSIICIMVMWIAKQKYYAYMLGIMLMMTIVGNIMLWGINMKHSVDSRLKSIENITNNVKDTVYAVDRVGETVENTVDKVKQPLDKGYQRVTEFDKRVTNKTDGFINRLLGRDKK